MATQTLTRSSRLIASRKRNPSNSPAGQQILQRQISNFINVLDDVTHFGVSLRVGQVHNYIDWCTEMVERVLRAHDGVVCAVLLGLLLMAAPHHVMGQTLQEQRACSMQATEFFTTHFSGELAPDVVAIRAINSHCYARVLVVSHREGIGALADGLFDVFTGDEIAFWSSAKCYVGKSLCHGNHLQFNTLLFTKFPAFAPR